MQTIPPQLLYSQLLQPLLLQFGPCPPTSTPSVELIGQALALGTVKECTRAHWSRYPPSYQSSLILLPRVDQLSRLRCPSVRNVTDPVTPGS